MTDNSRIRQIAPGVVAEVIAEQVHFEYAPGMGEGDVIFQARESLFVGDAYQPLTGSYDILQAPLSALRPRCFAPEGALDPVTGAPLHSVSSAGVELIMKYGFDALHNERAAERAAAAAAAEEAG